MEERWMNGERIAKRYISGFQGNHKKHNKLVAPMAHITDKPCVKPPTREGRRG